MIPQEKAQDLIQKYLKLKSVVFTVIKEKMALYIAKQSALIAVEETLNAHLFDLDEKEYWQEVKQEIEKL